MKEIHNLRVAATHLVLIFKAHIEKAEQKKESHLL